VAESLIFGDKEAAFLKELARQRVPFMVVGLSAAALQGAPVVTQDVDLWFKNVDHPGIQKALAKVGGIFVPSWGLNPPTFAGVHVKMFDMVLTMQGLGTFDREARNTIEVPLGRCRIKVLKLDRIIRSKTALNRQKDQMVLPVLRAAWAVVHPHVPAKKHPAPRKTPQART
jgi:hypothetical protein